jgi:hypothetical protein
MDITENYLRGLHPGDEVSILDGDDNYTMGLVSHISYEGLVVQVGGELYTFHEDGHSDPRTGSDPFLTIIPEVA